ncbi:tRNA (mnm(5)s(2)U34)-methyltransferase [Anaerovorax odorimutans]|uniref:tRNA (mnm(5)s(2)U34)-methyltransferase n=1 Tax=Anaerovorax odorimutans TaxID=109327 RepID=UPI0004068274|nr:class I SAM-dependent methyltransferase [Anaerovorax odorimutans]
MKAFFINSVDISKKICESILEDGDIAVDCTMGNGNDTAFLCSLIGNSGKVYAFDVQQNAVLNTRDKLLKLGFLERTYLILDGHENIDKYVKEKVKLIIFNLGYLPKGNHNITTKKETTIESVKKCLNILKRNGIILLVVYPGHNNGKEEKESLEIFTSQLDQKEYTVVKFRFLNQINNPPELICIEKIF